MQGTVTEHSGSICVPFESIPKPPPEEEEEEEEWCVGEARVRRMTSASVRAERAARERTAPTAAPRTAGARRGGEW